MLKLLGRPGRPVAYSSPPSEQADQPVAVQLWMPKQL